MIYSLVPNIEEHPVFRGLTHEYTRKYLNECSITVKQFPADTLAYSSKNKQLQAAIIIEGSACVYVGTGDEKALMRTLHNGDIFGVANLYDYSEPFPSYIVTATEATILFIDGNAFKEFIENNNQATKNYIGFLSKKIVFLNRKLATLTAGSAEKKLAAYISEHNVNGVFEAGSLSELANILQMGRASLYRAIDILTDRQLVEKKGKVFVVLDKENLKNL
ncbi:MAG: Crp/Fnr family transcriptional regulator [Clostridia bacterium]|nr:Crp/Fnr family transcriptional regulator [Clostridia bacterium]